MKSRNRRSVSLIAWLSGIGKYQKKLSGCVRYNNEKAQRLRKLYKLINFPINQIHYINGEDFQINNPKLKKIVKERGNPKKLHAFKISPKEEYTDAFNIIKKYGLTVSKFIKYLASLDIDLNKTLIRITDYRGLLKCAAIIIIDSNGIVGEIIKEKDYILIYKLKHQESVNIIPFFLEYGKPLQVLSEDKNLINSIEKMLAYLKIDNKKIQTQLKKHDFSIYKNYLGGYYEFLEATNGQSVFTDVCTKKISNNLDIKSTINFLKKYRESKQNLIRGFSCCFNKKIRGKVQKINKNNIKKFKSGNILVCRSIDTKYLPAIKKAKAIISDRGGITSHQAIIIRELNISCLMGTKNATRRLKDNDYIEIDTRKGTVEILKKQRKGCVTQ